MGPSPHWAATTRGVICGLWVYLRFLFCEKGVFALVIRGPSWPSPTVAPEPLLGYPLGNRRG
jgi:hypothetical protein